MALKQHMFPCDNLCFHGGHTSEQDEPLCSSCPTVAKLQNIHTFYSVFCPFKKSPVRVWYTGRWMVYWVWEWFNIVQDMKERLEEKIGTQGIWWQEHRVVWLRKVLKNQFQPLHDARSGGSGPHPSQPWALPASDALLQCLITLWRASSWSWIISWTRCHKGTPEEQARRRQN